MNIRKLFQGRTRQLMAAIAIVAAVAIPLKFAHASVPADCNDNAVVWCGAYNSSTGSYDLSTLTNAINNGDGHNSAANIQSIYSTFGVTTANLAQTTDGYVTSTGQVFVNGDSTPVATNVWSAGRDYIPGSVQMGSIYLRPTSVSFLAPQLDAFVYMSGSTFEYAVIKSCGNPVFTINQPFGQIYKRVILPDGSTVAADTQATAASEAAGSTFTYQVTVTNNGTAPMTNTVATDTLPAGVADVATPSQRTFSANLGTIAVGAGASWNITVMVTDSTVGDYINNTSCFTADQGQTGCNNAWIQVTAPGSGTTPSPTTTPSPSGTPSATPSTTPSTTPSPTSSGTPSTTPTTTPSHTPTAPACTANTPCTPPTSGKLPQTGAGDVFGGAGAIGSMGYAARAYLRSKRGLLDALRRK